MADGPSWRYTASCREYNLTSVSLNFKTNGGSSIFEEKATVEAKIIKKNKISFCTQLHVPIIFKVMVRLGVDLTKFAEFAIQVFIWVVEMS